MAANDTEDHKPTAQKSSANGRAHPVQDAHQEGQKASNDAGPKGDSPREVRVGKLNTVPLVREEMARLYRTARKVAGPRLTPGDATKLGYLLNAIGTSIMGSDVMERLEALERSKEGGQ